MAQEVFQEQGNYQITLLEESLSEFNETELINPVERRVQEASTLMREGGVVLAYFDERGFRRKSFDEKLQVAGRTEIDLDMPELFVDFAAVGTEYYALLVHSDPTILMDSNNDQLPPIISRTKQSGSFASERLYVIKPGHLDEKRKLLDQENPSMLGMIALVQFAIKQEERKGGTDTDVHHTIRKVMKASLIDENPIFRSPLPLLEEGVSITQLDEGEREEPLMPPATFVEQEGISDVQEQLIDQDDTMPVEGEKISVTQLDGGEAGPSPLDTFVEKEINDVEEPVANQDVSLIEKEEEMLVTQSNEEEQHNRGIYDVVEGYPNETDEVDEYLRDISKAALITHAREIELAAIIKRGGKDAEKAIEEFSLANMKLVASVAKKYVGDWHSYKLNDLCQEGFLD